MKGGFIQRNQRAQRGGNRRGESAAWLGPALQLVLGVVACTPKPGDRCDPGQVLCPDDRTKLSCQEGRLLSSPCHGPFGCAVADGTVTCDISGNAAGDGCPAADEGHAACAPDGTHALRCHEGRLVVEPCHGPEGCHTGRDGPACDHAIAASDQLCAPSAEGRSACSVEGTHLLLCRDGTFTEQHPCRGPRGCRLEEGRLRCDRSIAVVGEDCTRLSEGAKACSADGKSLLSCDGDEFVLHRPCPAGCRATREGKLYCPDK